VVLLAALIPGIVVAVAFVLILRHH